MTLSFYCLCRYQYNVKCINCTRNVQEENETKMSLALFVFKIFRGNVLTKNENV